MIVQVVAWVDKAIDKIHTMVSEDFSEDKRDDMKLDSLMDHLRMLDDAIIAVCVSVKVDNIRCILSRNPSMRPPRSERA